tara:strand:+ start:553 stop:1896 length:1344 start_codon:yes stop_codon:yes gene_type:complete
VAVPPATPQSRDGRDYARSALEAGAPIVLGEGEAPEGVEPERWLRCEPIRQLYPRLAASLAGDPSAQLQLVGVTGTDGKTSVSWLLSHLLEALDARPCGQIGTLGWRWGQQWRDSQFTTPPAAQLQPGLADMVADGVATAVMEVSSHAIVLGRVEEIGFTVVALTTLGRDHLDFHGDLETYHRVKTGFIGSQSKTCRVVVPAHLAMGETAGIVPIRVGPGGDFAQERIGPQCWRLRTPAGSTELDLPLHADFQVDNLLTALAIAHALGRPVEALLPLVAQLPPIPGRLEAVGQGAVVDFAHTPEALSTLHEQLRPATRGRLITVFGCGGDRDQGKRPAMARIVQSQADLAILTSDNPRSEDPEAILDEAQAGFRGEPLAADDLGPESRGWIRLADRRQAIELAWAQRGPDDLVLVAGKGAETHQEIDGKRYPFDDREELRRLMEREC